MAAHYYFRTRRCAPSCVLSCLIEVLGYAVYYFTRLSFTYVGRHPRDCLNFVFQGLLGVMVQCRVCVLGLAMRKDLGLSMVQQGTQQEDLGILVACSQETYSAYNLRS